MTTDPPASAASDPHPTCVRHLVVAVTVLMAVILYLDRFCVSFAERYIKEDLGLGETQMAWFLGAFFGTYALGQVPSGWLGDRLGSRGVLALYIVSWSLFTAMIGMAEGFVILLAMRLGCGLGQAGAYPAAGSLLSRWVPFSGRGFASGLVALGGRCGAVIAPLLTGYLMVVFVPLSASPLLDEHTILDGVGLCTRLQPDDDSKAHDEPISVEARIGQLLPSDARWIVEKYGKLAQEYARARRIIAAESQRMAGTGPKSERSAAESDKSGSPLDLTCDPEELRILAAGLNSLLARSDLFSAGDFERLKNPEREALQLQARRHKGETLSNAETERLNRLILEGLFPKEIGKLYVKGWRPVLVVYGIAGVVVAVVFWSCFRNSPADHPWCNAAERELIAGGAQASGEKSATPPARFPAREVFSSGSLWLSSISQFTTNIAWLFFVTYFPRYLLEIHNVPILERSVMAAVPPLAGIAGMFLGGRLTDSLVPRIGLRWGRALPMGLTRFFAAATYLVCLMIDSPWRATIAFALGFFFVDLGVSAVWAYMQDVGGKNVGSILGWGNMWGNIGAFFAPALYNQVLGPHPNLADWNTMFLFCAAMFVISGLTGLWVDATVPIVPKPPPGDLA